MNKVLLAALLLLPGAAVHAASISTQVSTFIEGNDYSCGDSGGPSASCMHPSGQLFATATITSGLFGAETNAEAGANAIPGWIPEWTEFASAAASIEDVITILGGTGDGTLDYSVSFRIGGSGVAAASLGEFFSWSCEALGPVCPNDFNQETVLTGSAPFIFGTPIPISWSATAKGKYYPDQGPANGQGGKALTTVRFTIRDAEGRALPIYFITSESGLAYTPLQAIPEPSSVALCLAGLVVFIRLSRKYA